MMIVALIIILTRNYCTLIDRHDNFCIASRPARTEAEGRTTRELPQSSPISLVDVSVKYYTVRPTKMCLNKGIR